MEDKEFNALADAVLARIDAGLEASGADIDFELAAGGVLENECRDLLQAFFRLKRTQEI